MICARCGHGRCTCSGAANHATATATAVLGRLPAPTRDRGVVSGRAEEARWSIPTRDLTRFRAPHEVRRVVLDSDEVSTLDKLSNRPDYLRVVITYQPAGWLIESRSLRLYYQSLRDELTSVEGVAATIVRAVFETVRPAWVEVVVHEKPRGGIAITASARLPLPVPSGGTDDPYDAWAASH